MGRVMSQIKGADKLTVWTEVKEKSILIHYDIVPGFSGHLTIYMPFNISPYDGLIQSLFGLWGGVFLGQLCLAKSIAFGSPTFAAGWEVLLSIVANLYEIRAYRDRLSFPPLPQPENLNEGYVSPYKTQVSNKACLLWSGGIDSSLSLLLLQKNGYEVIPIHVTINTGAIGGEIEAVRNMANQLGVQLHIVSYEFDDYLRIAKSFSNVIDIFPLENPVPHGRELLLVPIAILFALQLGAHVICLGHEHNAWTRQIEYQGRKIYRCDTQSEPANMVMQEFISKFICPEMHLFSPVASLSDYQKFYLMSKRYPEVLANTVSCFWGNWCGLCQKCSLYYILQRMAGLNVLSFQVDPIDRNEHLRRIIYEWDNRELTNWAEHHFALATIVKAGRFGSSERLMLHYYDNAFPHIEPTISELERILTTIYDVRLIPSGFEFGL